MLKIAVVVVFSFVLLVNSMPLPQPRPDNFDDMKTAAILIAAQGKEFLDQGMGAHHGSGIDIFGFKVKEDVGIGFGEAVRERRSQKQNEESSSSSESEE